MGSNVTKSRSRAQLFPNSNLLQARRSSNRRARRRGPQNRLNPDHGPQFNDYIPRGPDDRVVGYAQSLTVTQTYTASLAHTINTGNAWSTAYQFRLNSLFDPDLTSAGHQPLGRDQWALLYNSYVVLSVRIRLDLATTANCNVAWFTQTDNTSQSLPTGSEQPGAEGFTLGNGTARSWSRVVDVAKALGSTRRQLVVDPTYHTAQGSNPTRVPSWTIMFQSPSTTDTTITAFYKIEFEVYLTDPTLQTQS
jgi:hypothetical protein